MPAPVLQFKRGNAGVAGTVPALRPGEPAISLNNFDFFIGIDTSVANNKFFGSHRYWTREDGTNSLKLNLVDKNGSNYVSIAASDTLAGIATYRLPNTTNGSTGDFLKVKSVSGGYYDLEWAAIPSGSFTLSDGTNTDTFTTGQTLTFAGTASEIETTVTDNQVQIGLPNNVVVGGALTVTTGAVIDAVRIGISGASEIDTSSGNLTLDSATGTTIIDDNLEVTGNINCTGNVSVGGTTVTLRGTDVFIENKDIILGYTTSITPNDDTANHAGVAIASTVGSPLVSFTASGINTLPDTYKQMMWFKSGTLGFSTDAFGFNYGVAIGTTTMASGVRLAVGSGITMSDTAITASNFYGTFNGSVTGNAAYADNAGISTQVKTVSAGDNPGQYHLTFVDSNNGSATAETVYTDDGIYYNPGANLFTTQHASFTGNINVAGIATLAGTVNLGDSSGDAITVKGTATFEQTIIGTATTANRAGSVDVVGVATNQNYYVTLVDSSGNAKSVGVDAELLYNPNSNTLTIGPGVGITAFYGSVSTGNSTSSVPTSSAVIDYVTTTIANTDTDDDLTVAGDTGGNLTIDLDTETLTIAGTANEIETSGSGNTITVGLPNDVVVGTSLSAPTIKTATIQHSNGTQAATIDTSGNITAAQNLTVSGNLFVNGSTTQVNTSELTVYDRTITLGVTTAGTTPTTTSWDLGVLMNYGDAGVAKTAGVIWKYGNNDVERFQFATNTDNPGSGGDANAPDITVATFAPIEIGALWVNDCAGQSQVISCTGTERFLENITVDAGTF